MAHQATPENPPPYKSSSPSEENVPDNLLEPSLKFDSETVLSNLHKSDQAFAREVVSLIARRAQQGVFSHHSWGYSFTELSVLPCFVHADGDRKLKSKFFTSKRADGIRGSDLMLIRIGNDIILLRTLRDRIYKREGFLPSHWIFTLQK
jgi:hypothetical protein